MTTLRHALARSMALVVAAGGALPQAAWAGSANSPAGVLPATASVALDFKLSIDAFLFFRIGDGEFPLPGGDPASVTFTATPAIPGGPDTAVEGNNLATAWTGMAPGTAAVPGDPLLPVEVRSNAGQVSLRATVSSALASGANTIPMSKISILTSDDNVPPPPLPDTGTGAGVNVAGGGDGTTSALVTLRTATWGFFYSDSVFRTAGTYTGMLTFTASTP